MLMVKVFTQNESFTPVGKKEQEQLSADQFEQALYANLRKLSKDPEQRTIDSILGYSKSLRK